MTTLIQRSSNKTQCGVGLIEVLVALLLLSVTVLGYATLQLQAMHAAQTANQRLQAMSLARDLAERMRVNRQGLSAYQTSATNQNSAVSCAVAVTTAFCQPVQMAAYDLVEINEKAKLAAMQVAVLPCQNILKKRLCIYVAWGQTTPTNGETAQDCTSGAVYVPRAHCIMLETYAYAS